MSDYMRSFLLTGFICASCGERLTLSSNDIPKEHMNKYFDGEPTGAAKVAKIIAIHPCNNCLEPVEEIKKAMKVLNAL